MGGTLEGRVLQTTSFLAYSARFFVKSHLCKDSGEWLEACCNVMLFKMIITKCNVIDLTILACALKIPAWDWHGVADFVNGDR